MDRLSNASAWESAWYPGEAPGEARGSWLGGFSFPLLSLADALSLLCPWVSDEVFYSVISFNEASEDTGFQCFPSSAAVGYYTGRFVFSFSPAFLCIIHARGCQNKGRPELTDRRQHVRI